MMELLQLQASGIPGKVDNFKLKLLKHSKISFKSGSDENKQSGKTTEKNIGRIFQNTHCKNTANLGALIMTSRLKLWQQGLSCLF